MEYVVKPSSYISSLCYSVFRLEPFTSCGYGCVYCYARWYRGPHSRVAVKPWVAGGFERIARRLPRGLPRPFFRLSTLSDPFQPVDGSAAVVVKRLLRIALRYEVPLIVNTKGLVSRDPEALWLLASLADRGLVVVQYSIGFGDGVSSLLEPGAPPATARLGEVETLSRHGVPVVVRVQPLLPGLEGEHLRAAGEALARGALGLVGEPLRETRQGLDTVYRLLGLDWRGAGCWEPYQLGVEPGREPLLHPCPRWRMGVHAALEAVAAGGGAVYSTCKDALLTVHRWYRPGRSCCLEWLAYRDEPLLRVTLHEYSYLGWPRLDPEALCQGLGGPYVCGSRLDRYPAVVRKAVRLHLARLRRLLGDPHRLRALLARLGAGEAPPWLVER